MGLVAKIFGGNNRNKKIANWARSVPLSDLQKSVMWELWQASLNKKPPHDDPLTKLSDEDKAYVFKVCSSDYRPAEFGSADVYRVATFRFFNDLGFTWDQSAIIAGMMFNMVGRQDI